MFPDQIATGVCHIGRERNRLEESEDGLDLLEDETFTEYRDARAEWAAALPALRWLRDERGWRYLADVAVLSEREIRYVLDDGKLPRSDARAGLLEALAHHGSDVRPIAARLRGPS